jgi:hypothetical protein
LNILCNNAVAKFDIGDLNPLKGVDLNPFKGIEAKIQTLNNKIDNFIYWINPVHWFTELWQLIGRLFRSGTMDIPLLVVTIAAIWLIMIGADVPKKYIVWTWIGFWLLRAVVFK